MKAYRYLMVAGLVLATAVAIPAAAQNQRDDDDRGVSQQDRDRGRENGQWQNNPVYKNGYNDGVRDRGRRKSNGAKSRRYKNDNDRRAYEQGYNDGYRSQNNDPWRGNAGGNPNREAYPNDGDRGGRQNSSSGYQAGYQNGLSYGQHDRSIGRPYKPTDSQVYHDGNRGYNSSDGDRGLYREQFRQGYQEGYQRGYNGR
jgi:hypothetical protein